MIVLIPIKTNSCYTPVARFESLSHEVIIRFLTGGTIVSVFAVVGNLFKPKTFVGLFGAAPSVALATLTLTVNQNGASYASAEARSMLVGALALLLYSVCVVILLFRVRVSAFAATLVSVAGWLCAAFGTWFVFLK